jgi:peptidoglycan/LPS O-acetylase OafA/YrhL
VEEQFYLFWPLVLLFTKPSKSLKIIVFTILLALIVRTYLYFVIGSWMAVTYFTLSCMHALGIGALLAYLALYEKQFIEVLKKQVWIYVSCTVYLILLVIQNAFGLEWYEEIVDEFIFAICAAFLILRASENGFSGLPKILLENKLVVYSGKISYGLYVFHLFIPGLWDYLSDVTGLKFHNNYMAFVFYYLTTFVISHLSWIFIERPINSLKRKVPYI